MIDKGKGWLMALFCFLLPKNGRLVLLSRKMQSNNKNARQIFKYIFSFSNLHAIIIQCFIYKVVCT